MIDPLVSLLMPPEEQATQNDISHYIQVEEAIDCRNSNRRFFSLLNRVSSLNIIISEQSTIVSCKLDRHEIVVDKTLYNETHETWAIGDRPYQKLSNLLWNSHVRGSELVLSSSSSMTGGNFASNLIAANNSNPHTTLYFELTRSNELNCMGKLKSIHMQHQVFYFNLNRAAGSRAPVDGHRLAVRCNGNLNQIQLQPTKLLCQCNKSSPSAGRLAQSLVSDIPCELAQQRDATMLDNNDNPDDIILCDAIYSLESTSPLDYIQAQLQFADRTLVFEVRSVRSAGSAPAPNGSSGTTGAATTTNTNSNSNDYSKSNNNNNNGGNSNVSSSTSRGRSKQQSSTNIDLMQQQIVAPNRQAPHQSSAQSSSLLSVNQQVDDSIATSSSSSSNFGPSNPIIKSEPLETASGAPTSSSEVRYQFANNNAKVAQQTPTSTQHPSTILRIRVRVTNFGVCLLPHMMTNYSCTYKFAWL